MSPVILFGISNKTTALWVDRRWDVPKWWVSGNLIHWKMHYFTEIFWKYAKFHGKPETYPWTVPWYHPSSWPSVQTWCTEKAARWRPSWTHRRRGRRVSHDPAVERTTWHPRDCRALNNNKHSVGIRLHPQSATAPWWVVSTPAPRATRVTWPGCRENNLAPSWLSSSK